MTVSHTRDSYVHGGWSTPLIGETIGGCLDRAAVAHANDDALISVHQNLRYTYSELHAEVERFARGLLMLGVSRGDSVGIWSSNCAEWVMTQYACAKVGAILVNINPAYRVRELEYALNHSDVSVLVMARGFRNTDYVALLTEIAPELQSTRTARLEAARLPKLRRVVYLGDDPGPGAMAWVDLAAKGQDLSESRLREREAELQFDDPITIQYTSGTTGHPKGATLSHHNILNNGYFIGERLRYTSRDRICVQVPLYHCFGCVIGNLAALTHGSAVVLPASTFDPEAGLRAIHEERCTSLYGVPTMFIAQLDHPSFGNYQYDSLRTGVMAGAPCPIEVMRQIIDRLHMPEVTICYGMTETSPVSFQSTVDDAIENRVSTVGTIHPHVECKIVDPTNGHIVPRGESGELCTRGYCVMLGYWNDKAATDSAIDEAGWMQTGDLAVMHDDGHVNIVGRLKDMIIRGGENIYPREVEQFLSTHPAVSEVQVIGVPDDKYGEAVCAWIRLREGHMATSEDIRQFCKGQIATFKAPRYIRFTNDFPMTVTGKIQKYRMREVSIAELGLERADPIKTA